MLDSEFSTSKSFLSIVSRKCTTWALILISPVSSAFHIWIAESPASKSPSAKGRLSTPPASTTPPPAQIHPYCPPNRLPKNQQNPQLQPASKTCANSLHEWKWTAPSQTASAGPRLLNFDILWYCMELDGDFRERINKNQTCRSGSKLEKNSLVLHFSGHGSLKWLRHGRGTSFFIHVVSSIPCHGNPNIMGISRVHQSLLK